MLSFNYIFIAIIIITLGILYQKYLDKSSKTFESNSDNYDGIRKYFLSDKTLDKTKKPILWVHIPYEYNSRDWLSFGSRSSFDLNQPYLYLCVKSIIKCCKDSFKIVLIDDNSFTKLIPNWSINISTLTSPMNSYVRQLALAKILNIYGGINVPISFLCFRDLIGLYHKGTNDDSMFVCENYNENISSTNNLFYPNVAFMGSKKENPILERFIDFIQRTISDDYTAQTQFLGEFDKWCTKNKVRIIPGTDVGTKTVDEEPVTVETLLGNSYVNFYSKMYGIWIPSETILKRNYYSWFARLSPKQIFESNFILAKYFVLALAPDSNNGIVEPLENANPDWVSFWKVPATNGTLNIFGLKPNYLGNNVPRAKNAGNLS